MTRQRIETSDVTAIGRTAVETVDSCEQRLKNELTPLYESNPRLLRLKP